MELRSLQDRLDLANSRVRAAESLLAIAVQEKIKFMQGAAWIAEKVQQQSKDHALRMRLPRNPSFMDESPSRSEQPDPAAMQAEELYHKLSELCETMKDIYKNELARQKEV